MSKIERFEKIEKDLLKHHKQSVLAGLSDYINGDNMSSEQFQKVLDSL